MRRLLRTLLFGLFTCLAGALAAAWFLELRGRQKLPDPPTIVEKVKEAARLETLDVTLYKTVSFAPDPERSTGSLARDVVSWAKFTLLPKEGKAIVFAVVHVGLDLERLDAQHLRVRGDSVEVALPPVVTAVELRPGDTVVVGSNLDSQQTMQLLELSKDLFGAQVRTDPGLQMKAKAANERAIRAMLITLGFRNVTFADAPPSAANPG